MRKKLLSCNMNQYEQNNSKSIAKEGGIRFYTSAEEQELARLQEAINRTDTEKFYHLMTLMKLQRIMQKPTDQHK